MQIVKEDNMDCNVYLKEINDLGKKTACSNKF